MKLSREKMIYLSHRILDYLNHEDRVEFFAEPQEIRQDIFRMFEAEMRTDEAIDAAVRRKLESQKRIVEGSSEWDVLYRKYYEEEAFRFRKVMP